MLRLSTKPQRRPRIGLALGSNRLSAARLSPADEGWSVDWSRETMLSESLFRDEPTARHESVLCETVGAIASEAARTYEPVHIALPDAAASFAVFPLEELPEGDASRRELVRWSFENDRHLRGDDFACAYQAMGVDEDNKHLMYACAQPQRWLDVLLRACKQAGIVPWAIDTAFAFHFNRLQDRLDVAPDGGAALIIGPQDWTLLVWDNQLRPRLIRSRWLEETEDAAATTAQEVERLLRAYLRGDARRSVSRLYLSGTGIVAERVGQALNARARMPVIRIDLCADISGEPVPAGLPRTAVIAAVAR